MKKLYQLAVGDCEDKLKQVRLELFLTHFDAKAFADSLGVAYIILEPEIKFLDTKDKYPYPLTLAAKGILLGLSKAIKQKADHLENALEKYDDRGISRVILDVLQSLSKIVVNLEAYDNLRINNANH